MSKSTSASPHMSVRASSHVNNRNTDSGTTSQTPLRTACTAGAHSVPRTCSIQLANRLHVAKVTRSEAPPACISTAVAPSDSVHWCVNVPANASLNSSSDAQRSNRCSVAAANGSTSRTSASPTGSSTSSFQNTDGSDSGMRTPVRTPQPSRRPRPRSACNSSPDHAVPGRGMNVSPATAVSRRHGPWLCSSRAMSSNTSRYGPDSPATRSPFSCTSNARWGDVCTWRNARGAAAASGSNTCPATVSLAATASAALNRLTTSRGRCRRMLMAVAAHTRWTHTSLTSVHNRRRNGNSDRTVASGAGAAAPPGAGAAAKHSNGKLACTAALKCFSNTNRARSSPVVYPDSARCRCSAGDVDVNMSQDKSQTDVGGRRATTPLREAMPDSAVACDRAGGTDAASNTALIQATSS